VVVVLHEAVGVAPPAVASNDIGEQAEKPFAVFVGQEHGAPVVAANTNVILSARRLYTKSSSHRAERYAGTA
jgi:hypothetical protein